MRRFSSLALLFFLALDPPYSSPQDIRIPRQPLWYWAGSCEKKYLELEVLLNGRLIHRSSFAICRVIERPGTADGQDRIQVFSFPGGHVFQGKLKTARTQAIEGNVWQAGADPDAILLGLTFSSSNRLLLNTIHVAKPDKESISEIDRGLNVRTYPIRRERWAAFWYRESESTRRCRISPSAC
jgi:hypothetical protein